MCDNDELIRRDFDKLEERIKNLENKIKNLENVCSMHGVEMY